MAFGDYIRHQAHVTGWLKKNERGLSNEQLVDLLELALSSLWESAALSVGEVTLAAVLDRTVVNACEMYKWLPNIVVSGGAADFSVLREAAPRLNRRNVLRAVHFILTDFQAILGNLTAETITPALNRQLANARFKKARRANRGKLQ